MVPLYFAHTYSCACDTVENWPEKFVGTAITRKPIGRANVNTEPSKHKYKMVDDILADLLQEFFWCVRFKQPFRWLSMYSDVFLFSVSAGFSKSAFVLLQLFSVFSSFS